MKTTSKSSEAVLCVNLLTDDRLLAARLAQFGRRAARLRVRCSDRPLRGCGAYLFPALALPSPGELQGLKARGAAVLAYGPAELLRSAFLAGCDDYLKEPWSPEELECRLDRLAARSGLPGQEERGWRDIRLRGGRLCAPGGEAALSFPESRILEALLARPGEAVGREVLAYAVWGRPAACGSRALDMQVAGLRRKLGSLASPGKRAVRIRALRGVGYALC